MTLDELGHVLGLDHHVNLADDSDYGDAVVQTYSRAKPKAFYNAHVFGRCDIATLQQVYDVATVQHAVQHLPRRPDAAVDDGDADLGRRRVGRHVHAPRSGSAGTGRLSNNAVSGRTVVLQQRTASGWTDVADDGPGLRRGHVLGGARDAHDVGLRALFRKPSTEGLRGSSSAADHRDRQRGLHHGPVSAVRPDSGPVSPR